MSKYRFGLIGKSLAHSFSKDFFSDFFLKNKVDGIYENLEFEGEEELRVFFDSEIRNFRGLNVTIPYKKAVLPFIDEIDDAALKIGAVNTIKRIGSKTIGFNTDAYGFQQSIKPFLTNKHEKALVLGTGGASKAIEYTLQKLGIEVLFISRLESDLGHVFTYEEMNKYMIDACKLIVNCTPVGMFPNENQEIKLPYHCLSSDHLVIDLIYNPTKTKFLENAERNGAQILNGSSMLKEQAMKSWKIWNEYP